MKKSVHRIVRIREIKVRWKCKVCIVCQEVTYKTHILLSLSILFCVNSFDKSKRNIILLNNKCYLCGNIKTKNNATTNKPITNVVHNRNDVHPCG